MLFILTDSSQKLKLKKVHGASIIIFYVSPSSPHLQSRFKENAKVLSKSSPTQENITIVRENLLLFFIKNTKKATTLQQVTGGEIPNLVLKRMLERFLKVPPLKKIRIPRLKEDCKTYTKRKTKPIIKLNK